MRKMCKDLKKTSEQDLQALYEVLEGRYSPDLAQQIVDEIKKAENPVYLPDYVAVKSISEAVEVIRPKTLKALKSLKQAKLAESDLPDGVESLNLKRAGQGFERLLGAYLLAKGTYRDFYTRIMDDVQKRHHIPRYFYVDMPRRPETVSIRKAA